ncbi:MAG: phytoene desaturase [Pseudomonadota bacterium]
MTTHATFPDLEKTVNGPRPHAVVIGAGFGGLAAAIRLGARGYQVTLVEKLEQVGGRASVFRQDGFSFDAGPTIITAPFVFDELWSLCGRTFSHDVNLVPMEPFYRLRFDDGSTFACSSDEADMKAQIAAFNPADVKGYEALLKDCEKLYNYGFRQLADQPFHSLGYMLSTLPKMALHRADRTVFGHVAKRIKDPRLRIALSFYPLFIGGNPFSVTSMYNLILHLERTYGVHFVMGGTGALVEAMADLVKSQGGEIRLNAPVGQILVDGNRAVGVTLEDGEEIRSDIVVSNADALWAYDTLLAGRKAKRWTKQKLGRVKHSMSLVVWYFGTKTRYEDVDHHTILLGPRYKGLLDDIFKRKHLAEDFSLYLYRPTATDRSLAPEGCDTFYVLSPVPQLTGEVDWTERAEPYRQAIQERLESTILPGLSENIATSKLFTPLDFESRLNAPFGAAFGPEPRMLQSAWFRPHNLSEEIENLYLVGASTHPGAGVPSVVTSAKVLDHIVPDAQALNAQHG